MKQIVQNYKTGDLWLEEVPVPICKSGGVLVRNEYSVVSAGTERMKVDQARMSLIEKARARPDQVKQVLRSVKQFGLKDTIGKVQERLDSLTPLGYSSVGRVVEVGEGVDSLKVGDRVACAGEGIACHAEHIFVPRNLCAKVPEGVEPRDAAFGTVGTIVLNGLRQADVGLGDTVLVIGLGLVGLLGVQILKAAGCRVIGVDIDPSKIELAKECGAEVAMSRTDSGLMEAIAEMTSGEGVDAVYIAASTSSADPMEFAGEVCRDRGNVVIVGMVPIQAEWRVYYGKELNVIMSRSYGPGRYDHNYEYRGIDYPIGYIPWTLRRNLEEFVRLVGNGDVTPAKFGPTVFPLGKAPEAYQELHENASEHAVGMIFEYPSDSKIIRKVPVEASKVAKSKSGSVGMALIGAGNFSTGTLIPALKSASDVKLTAICSAGGLTAKSAANRHGFKYASSELSDVLADDDVDAVIIATRHDTHARFSLDALNAGKHVFVEKPLALNEEDLLELKKAQQASGKILMPGFNRRFSSLSKTVKGFFAEEGGPVEVVCRVNAGPIASDSWYQDSEMGGWRIVSEGCHFVDLISYLGGGNPKAVSAYMTGGSKEGGQNDNCIATIELDNGSIGVLIYVANGDTHFEKERIEVFGQERVAVIDNWHHAELCQSSKTRKVKADRTGKGHKVEVQDFVSAVKTGAEAPISFESAYLTTLTTLRIRESLLSGGEKKLLEP